MNLEMVTMWYNEEFFAPYFLEHYNEPENYVAKIHVILDADTDDKTEEICKQYKNVSVSKYKFHYGFDDILKIALYNKVLNNSTADFCIGADADELIMLKDLEKFQNQDVIGVEFYNIYTTPDDKPLDPTIHPIAHQRQHGIKDTVGQPIKQCIVKPNSGYRWDVGCHYAVGPEYIERMPEMMAMHWQRVDKNNAVNRLMRFKARLGQSNINLKLGYHYLTTKAQDVIDECDKYALTAPRIPL